LARPGWRPAPEVAEARRRAVEAGDPEAGLQGPPPWAPTRSPTGRRRSSAPLIEIARSASKDDALAGLERWKSRHPEAASLLEPADVLVDSMRGRSTTWTRIRLNLRHVPEAERPAAERPDPDYEPEWGDWSDNERDQWLAAQRKPKSRP